MAELLCRVVIAVDRNLYLSCFLCLSTWLEVVVNPADLWAWGGLIGDLVDLIPVLTGVGEVTKAVGASSKVHKFIRNGDNIIDAADDIIDTSGDILNAARKYAKNLPDTSDINNAYGTYVILYKNGSNYVGKGGFERALTSARQHLSTDDSISAILWSSAADERNSFIAEYYLQTVRGLNRTGGNTFNIRWSPGKTKLPR